MDKDSKLITEKYKQVTESRLNPDNLQEGDTVEFIATRSSMYKYLKGLVGVIMYIPQAGEYYDHGGASGHSQYRTIKNVDMAWVSFPKFHKGSSVSCKLTQLKKYGY